MRGYLPMALLGGVVVLLPLSSGWGGFLFDNAELLAAAHSPKEREFINETRKKSPSFQEKKWTGTQCAYESYLEYNYVGPASMNLGNGRNQRVDEQSFDARHVFMRHTLLAFLVQAGWNISI